MRLSMAMRQNLGPFRALFVGAGNIAFGGGEIMWNHSLRVEKHLGSRLNVVGIVDPSAQRVQEVLRQKRESAAALCYADTKYFSNVNEAKSGLANKMPHLLILGVPPQFRGTSMANRNLETQVIEAFGSSPAIFCEKPVSTARPEASGKIAEMIEKCGSTISIGYMFRYLKVVQKAKKIMEENDIKPLSISARYTSAYTKITKPDWWTKSKQCGPIVEQGTHLCDLMRYFGGEVDLNTVQAMALEHYEDAGKLQKLDVDEDAIPADDRIPRATAAVWKFKAGAVGSFTHTVALHGQTYPTEVNIAADGYHLRVVDLYTEPKLFARTPSSGEREEHFTSPNDDPFYSELATIIDKADGKSSAETQNVEKDNADLVTQDNRLPALPTQILSTFSDALKTYELTWAVRDRSEESSARLRAVGGG